MTLLIFNIQSLTNHKIDFLIDKILTNTNLVVLTETWLDNSNQIELDGYQCVVQSKRKYIKVGGVGIYKKINIEEKEILYEVLDLTNTNSDLMTKFPEIENYGDICSILLNKNSKKFYYYSNIFKC